MKGQGVCNQPVGLRHEVSWSVSREWGSPSLRRMKLGIYFAAIVCALWDLE